MLIEIKSDLDYNNKDHEILIDTELSDDELINVLVDTLLFLTDCNEDKKQLVNWLMNNSTNSLIYKFVSENRIINKSLISQMINDQSLLEIIKLKYKEVIKEEDIKLIDKQLSNLNNLIIK